MELQSEAAEELVKLLFVDGVIQLYATEPGYGAVFGGIKVSKHFFDANWTIESILIEADVDEAIEQALKEGAAQALMAASNARVQSLLTTYIERIGMKNGL